MFLQFRHVKVCTIAKGFQQMGSGRGILPLPYHTLSRHGGRTVRESLLPAVIHAESCSILRSLRLVPFTQLAPIPIGGSQCLPAFRQVCKSLLNRAKVVPIFSGQINRDSACIVSTAHFIAKPDQWTFAGDI